MATNIGKKHSFAGINFDFTNRGSLTLDMVGHLQDALDAFTEELGSTPTSPAFEFLFDVNPHAMPLSKKIEKYFTVCLLGCFMLESEQSPIIWLRLPF